MHAEIASSTVKAALAADPQQQSLRYLSVDDWTLIASHLDMLSTMETPKS